MLIKNKKCLLPLSFQGVDDFKFSLNKNSYNIWIPNLIVPHNIRLLIPLNKTPLVLSDILKGATMTGWDFIKVKNYVSWHHGTTWAPCILACNVATQKWKKHLAFWYWNTHLRPPQIPITPYKSKSMLQNIGNI